MGIFELIAIGIGLSMDAFAVSICKGLALKKMDWRNAIIAGVYFGCFQGFMPLLGYLLGIRFQSLITQIDHWIAFILLLCIGVNMIKGSMDKEAECVDSSFGLKAMLPLAVATSIDALAVGISFAFLHVNIVMAAFIIGITTFGFGIAGVKIGNVFGIRYKSKAELTGGIILILIGAKILIEHLGII